ncbi:MAG: MFS transporter [Lachnospiraceae bacterium]|nr:MFS transporter [Lachnospiraceae bacterium]
MQKNRKNLIYILCYFAYASIYIARLNLSVATPLLRDSHIMSTEQIGYLGTAFSVVYAFGRLLNGVRADFVQPRVMISIGLVLCFFANLGMGILPPFSGMLLFWCVNAFAQSMLWSSVLRFINYIYLNDKAKLTRLSAMVSSVAAGNVLGILICTWIIEKMDLVMAFLIPGCITLVLGATVFLIFPRITEENRLPEKQTGIREIFSQLRNLLSDKEIRTAAFPSLLHGIIKDNVTLWMVVYFVDTFGIDISKIAGYVLFIPIVGFAARMIYPCLLKKCRNDEHRVSIFSFFGCTACSLCIVFSESPVLSVVCLSVIYSFMSLINSSMLSIFPIRFDARGCSASVSGIMDFSTYFGNGIGALLYGVMIAHWGFSSMYLSWIAVSLTAIWILIKLSDHKTSE